MVKMKLETDTKFIEKKIEGLGLGIFFIWIGTAFAFSFPLSAGLIGIAVVLFASQIARMITGLDAQWFRVFMGVIFLLSGFVQMVETKINLVAIFFIAIGILIFFRNLRVTKKSDK